MAGIQIAVHSSDGSSSSSASWQQVTVSLLAAISLITFLLLFIVLEANPNPPSPVFSNLNPPNPNPSSPNPSNPNVTSLSWGEGLAAAVAAAWQESSGLLRGGMKEAARDGEHSSGGPTLGVGGLDPLGWSKEEAAAAADDDASSLDFDAVGVAEWMPKLEPFEPPPGSESFFKGHSEEEVMSYLKKMSWELRNPVKPAGPDADDFQQLFARLCSIARDEFLNSARQLANRTLFFGGPCPSREFDFHSFQMFGRFSLGVLPWKPQESKFLLYNCHYGELGNQMQCLRKTLLLAGFLNRTLLIDMTHPELQYHHPYNRSLFFDVDHFRHCLGESVLMTTDEYRKKHGQEIKIDESIIWKRYASVYGPSRWIPSDVTGVPEREVNLTRLSLAEFVRTFGSNNASIIHFNDLFYFFGAYEGAWWLGGTNDVPFIRLNSSKCFSLVQPAREVFEAARKFLVTRMNLQPFVCVHWRRGDFVNIGRPDCFVSVSNLSRSLHDVMTKYNIRRVVLVTNAESPEIEALKSKLYFNQTVTFFTALRRIHLPNLLGTSNYRIEFLALVEQIVCAMSSVFLSNECSTFSSEISRYRIALKTASCLDSFSWHA